MRVQWDLAAGLGRLILLVAWLTAGMPARAADEAADDGATPLNLAEELYGRSTDDLGAMWQRGSLPVLVPYSRTNYFVDDGEADGFEYRLLKKYEAWLNKHRPRDARGQRVPPMRLVFVPTLFETLFDDLEGGMGAIAAGFLTQTEARARRVAFTRPYVSGVAEILVTGPGVEAAAGIRGLSGRTVTVARGTTYAEALEQASRQLQAEGRAPITVRLVGDGIADEDLLALVDQGLIEATICDEPIAAVWQRVLPRLKLHHEVALGTRGRIGFAVRPGNPQLRASLDAFLETMPPKEIDRLGGDVARRLRTEEQAQRETLRRYGHLLEMVKTEATAAGLDWRLVAAQIRKESGFDPNATSPLGAVGLMQLMPETAEAMGVTDRRDPLQSIRGGIRYLIALRDGYFPDDALTPVERWRFVFAGYNAGPNRINRIRRAAPPAGIDPDRYLHNVELLVIRQRLAETYFYVRQIEGYYLAYAIKDPP
ncbi:MAG: transporter substrate-binding domain-containing protein [Alphaproteobacteria bacterium]|nr:transporter substrate-binding domain-containing protein [Alphaproteobacteria bacterium]